MNKVAAYDINAFRAAGELSSSESAQLKRTITELEARISEQDDLIALQNAELAELKERERELVETLNARSRSDPGRNDCDSHSYLEWERLEKANRKMEALIGEFEEGFWTLLSGQRHGLEDCLKALDSLPATPETKSLYARVKKEWQAIESAKKRNIITPVNALRHLADLERSAVTFILGRPKLTITTIETFRARVLVEAFETDRRLKSLSTNDSIRTISTREEKVIHRVQALRAMRRAAHMFPDRVDFEKKGKAARLIKAAGETGANSTLRCIITVCYMIYACNSLFQTFGEMLEELICTFGGIFW